MDMIGTAEKKSSNLSSAVSRREIILGIAVIWIVAGLAFHRIVDHGYVWDDLLNIGAHGHFGTLTGDALAPFWKAPYQHLYIPVTYTVWGVISALSPASAPSHGIPWDPVFLHAVNGVGHAINASIVFSILRTVMLSPPAALIGALLFVVHPLQVEPVAWITGLKDVLSSMFALIAVWRFLAMSVRAANKGLPFPRPIGFVLQCVFPSLLAVLAKPSAVVVPLLAATLWSIARSSRRFPRTAVGGWCLALAPAVVAGLLVQPVVAKSVQVAWPQRLVVALDAFGFYLGKLFWPRSLTVDYGRDPITVLNSGQTWFWALVPIGLGAALVATRRRYRYGVVAITLMFIGLLPNLGFAPFYFQRISTVADRYMYMAMLGPSLALAAVWDSCRRWALVPIAVGMMLLVATVGTIRQSEVWRNPFTLFRQVLLVNPGSKVAHSQLANEFSDVGRFEEAAAFYQEAMRRDPSPGDYYNLAMVLVKLGSLEPAKAALGDALKLKPNFGQAYEQLGRIALREKNLTEARSAFAAAVSLNPVVGPSFRYLVELTAAEESVALAQEMIDAIGARADPRIADLVRRLDAVVAQ